MMCDLMVFLFFLQVLRYFDYIFTGVFTFEMLIKVKKCVCLCVCVFVSEVGVYQKHIKLKFILLHGSFK